MIQTIQNFYPW